MISSFVVAPCEFYSKAYSILRVHNEILKSRNNECIKYKVEHGNSIHNYILRVYIIKYFNLGTMNALSIRFSESSSIIFKRSNQQFRNLIMSSIEGALPWISWLLLHVTSPMDESWCLHALFIL